MTELTIRLANENDSKDLALVFIDSFGISAENNEKLIENTTNSLKHRINKKVSDFYITLQNERAVGLGAETRFLGSSYIGYVGVLRSVWRQGIGTKLFQFILNEAEKHNPTIELFANPGVDRVYRKLDFKDQFLTYNVELTTTKEIQLEKVQEEEKIPQWIFDLDKLAMGCDRSHLLQFLISEPKTSLLSFEDRGYLITTDKKIGPVITKDIEAAYNLLNYSLATGKKTMLVPDKQLPFLKPFSPVEKQRCVKMIKGVALKNEPNLILGYNSFASS